MIKTRRDKDAITKKQALLIILGIVLGVLMGALDNLIVSTALPDIVLNFNQPSVIPFLIDAYVTSSAVGMVIFGKLSDHYDRKLMLLITLVIFIVGSVLAGMSNSLSELIIFRIIQGLGSGGFLPVGLAVIALTLPPKTRANITGAVTSFIGIAIVAGPALGAFIVDSVGWRWIFYVNIPLGIASLLIIGTTLEPLRPGRVRKFDVLGTVLLVAWVSLLLFPLVEVSNGGWSLGQPLPDGLILASLLITALFVLVEYRVVKEPIVPFRMFRHQSVVSSSAISFFRGGVIFTLSTFISIFVTEVLAGSSNILRDVLYGFVLPMVAGSIIGGVLLQRLSYRNICVLGTVLMTIGFIPLLNISPSTTPWSFIWMVPVGGLVFGLIPIGFGVGMTMAATTLSAQYSVEPQDIGASSSIVQFMGYIGGGIILSIVTVLVNTSYKSHIALGNSPAMSMSFSISSSFIVLFIMSLTAVISSVFMTGKLPISLEK
jgi:MFS family permease